MTAKRFLQMLLDGSLPDISNDVKRSAASADRLSPVQRILDAVSVAMGKRTRALRSGP
jgi:hypothetical protein